MTKLAVLCPVSDGVEASVFQYAMAMISKASQDGIEISQVGVTERQLVATARNILAKGFLETDCEWAFWMDSDHIFPAETITELLRVANETKSKFVTGIYHQRVGRHMPVIWKKDPVTMEGKHMYSKDSMKGNGRMKEAYTHHHISPSPNASKPFQVDVCGFGCVVTHREIFEKTEYPWFKTITDVCSEDFYFCCKAKEAGYQIWAYPKLRIGHLGNREVVYRDKYYDMIKNQEIAYIRM